MPNKTARAAFGAALLLSMPVYAADHADNDVFLSAVCQTNAATPESAAQLIFPIRITFEKKAAAKIAPADLFAWQRKIQTSLMKTLESVTSETGPADYLELSTLQTLETRLGLFADAFNIERKNAPKLELHVAEGLLKLPGCGVEKGFNLSAFRQAKKEAGDAMIAEQKKTPESIMTQTSRVPEYNI